MPFRAVQSFFLSAIIFGTGQMYAAPGMAQQASGPSDAAKPDAVKSDAAKSDSGKSDADTSAPSTSEAATTETATTEMTAAGAATGGGTVKGTVADPDSAVIPGATVTLTPIGKGGKAIVVKSQGDGSYTLQGRTPRR